MINNKSRGKMLYSYISHFIICMLHINLVHLEKQMEAITFYILRKKYVISRNIYLREKIKT